MPRIPLFGKCDQGLSTSLTLVFWLHRFKLTQFSLETPQRTPVQNTPAGEHPKPAEVHAVAGAVQMRPGLQLQTEVMNDKVFDDPPSLQKPFGVILPQDEVIHVAHIPGNSQLLFHQSIHRAEVKIGPMLAGETANRKPLRMSMQDVGKKSQEPSILDLLFKRRDQPLMRDAFEILSDVQL